MYMKSHDVKLLKWMNDAIKALSSRNKDDVCSSDIRKHCMFRLLPLPVPTFAGSYLCRFLPLPAPTLAGSYPCRFLPLPDSNHAGSCLCTDPTLADSHRLFCDSPASLKVDDLIRAVSCCAESRFYHAPLKYCCSDFSQSFP